MPNAKNVSLWRVFEKPEACCQTVLPDRSILIGQNLVENAKIEKFKCDILSNFQTLCVYTTFATFGAKIQIMIFFVIF